MGHQVVRYHDICAGHRVVNHESKCQHLHGHNYRIHFYCESDELDSIGRVIDFSVVKERLCMWVEDNYDHKFLAWEQDSLIKEIYDVLGSTPDGEPAGIFGESIVFVPYNPTAENIAKHLVEVVGPKQLEGTGVVLVKVLIEETAKCHASYQKD